MFLITLTVTTRVTHLTETLLVNPTKLLTFAVI
jgi:hypothetical protein